MGHWHDFGSMSHVSWEPPELAGQKLLLHRTGGSDTITLCAWRVRYWYVWGSYIYNTSCHIPLPDVTGGRKPLLLRAIYLYWVGCIHIYVRGKYIYYTGYNILFVCLTGCILIKMSGRIQIFRGQNVLLWGSYMVTNVCLIWLLSWVGIL